MKYQICHTNQKSIALDIVQDEEYIRLVVFAPIIIVIYVVIFGYVLKRDAMSGSTPDGEISR